MLMKLIYLFIFSAIALAQNNFGQKYLPEDRSYNSSDSGYYQYNTPSLYQTGQYVLTFDDGPHITRTPKILDTLKKYNIKATFFIITSRINQQTAPIIKRMIDEGHIVANHGVEHHNSNTIDKNTFKLNILDGFKKLKSTLNNFGIELKQYYYRFPYAAYAQREDYHHLNALRELSIELFNKNCIHFVFWDHDSADWVPTMNTTELITNIDAFQNGGEYYTYKVRNGQIIKIKSDNYPSTGGGVILFHDIQQKTVDALDAILNYFSLNNLEIIELGKVEEYNEADFAQCVF